MINGLRRLALVVTMAGLVGLMAACNQGGGGTTAPGGSVAPGGPSAPPSQSAPGGY